MSGMIEEQIAKQGFYVSTTVGCSMRPMLRNRRDRIIVSKLPEGDLKPMDLPLYRRPNNTYVLHRILAVKEDYYVIRGDNTFALEKVPKSWVIGYVTEFYRGKKHVKSDSKWYRLYARVWQGIYPIRWCVMVANRLAHRVLGPVKRFVLGKIKKK